MRITGGKARGIRLKAPPGPTVRPAMDAMREAVFSSLSSLVIESNTLDLFAGSGAYGLEALSRGAASSCFIERKANTLNYLRTNVTAVLQSIGTHLPHQVIQADVLKWKTSQCYSLVFVDPPYSLLETIGASILKRTAGLLEESTTARLVLEAPGGWQPPDLKEAKGTPPNLHLLKRLGKGRHQPSALIFGRA